MRRTEEQIRRKYKRISKEFDKLNDPSNSDTSTWSWSQWTYFNELYGWVMAFKWLGLDKENK